MTRSSAPRPRSRSLISVVTKSSTLEKSDAISLRSASVVPRPKIFSNTLPGSASIGSGVVGVRNEIVRL